jgi:hypothetical protein
MARHCTFRFMRGQRATLGLSLGFLSLLSAPIAQGPPPPADAARAALHRCREVARACRQACRQNPGPRGRVLCRRDCWQNASNCRRAARGQPPIHWAALAQCRGERRRCRLGCWNRSPRGPERAACLGVCKSTFRSCRRAARR